MHGMGGLCRPCCPEVSKHSLTKSSATFLHLHWIAAVCSRRQLNAYVYAGTSVMWLAGNCCYYNPSVSQYAAALTADLVD